MMLKLFLIEDNIRNWEVIFSIPSDSSSYYAGGNFHLEIEFSSRYPEKPPRLQMKTKIFHVNISNRGMMCIPLHSDWKPYKHTARDIIIEIQDLFDMYKGCHPNASWCLDALILYLSHRAFYGQYAKLCTQKFAQKVKKDPNESDVLFEKMFDRRDFEEELKFLTNLYVSWDQLRIFWIGYYKNSENDKCFVDCLPKDIIQKILKLIAQHVI